MLKELREAKDLTLRQAAFLAGISPSTLSRWESGVCVPRVPEMEALLKTLDAADTTLNRILSSVDVPRAARAARVADDDRATFRPPSGGALLKAMRMKSRLSLSEVATTLGVATSTISRWETSTTHPSPGLEEKLLDLLKATPDERECVLASGVSKLRFTGSVFNITSLKSELAHIKSSLIYGGSPGTELRLLQLQSALWWRLSEPGILDLLRQVTLVYAQYLCAWHRYPEATLEARKVVESCTGPRDASYLLAERWSARADVFRHTTPRPNQGLYTLQHCLLQASTADVRAEILTDMSFYSRLAKKKADAMDYGRRALALARDTKNPDLECEAETTWARAMVEVGLTAEAEALLLPKPTQSTQHAISKEMTRCELALQQGRSEQASHSLQSLKESHLNEFNLVRVTHLEKAIREAKYSPAHNFATLG